MRKARAFRGGANKTAPPCETLAIICYLATVPVEQLQRNTSTKHLNETPQRNTSTKHLNETPQRNTSTKYILRENGLQRPAKGGSTPAFACQRAAIAPLPYSNLQA